MAASGNIVVALCSALVDTECQEWGTVPLTVRQTGSACQGLRECRVRDAIRSVEQDHLGERIMKDMSFPKCVILSDSIINALLEQKLQCF